MLITAIERQPRRRARVEVHVDGQRRFDLSRDLARTRALRPGQPIDESEIAALVALDARRESLRTAASMIARRPRSEREVRQRLAMRRFDATVIAETVTKLKTAGLLDDRAFAESWVEARDDRSPRGRRLVAAELRARGVDMPTAIEASDQISEEDAAYRAAAKRVLSLANADYAAFREKLAAHLQRRGFGWDVIRTTIDRCWRERGGGSDADPAFDDLEYAIE